MQLPALRLIPMRAGYMRVTEPGKACGQGSFHNLGKDEVGGSNPPSSSKNSCFLWKTGIFLYFFVDLICGSRCGGGLTHTLTHNRKASEMAEECRTGNSRSCPAFLRFCRLMYSNDDGTSGSYVVSGNLWEISYSSQRCRVARGRPVVPYGTTGLLLSADGCRGSRNLPEAGTERLTAPLPIG